MPARIERAPITLLGPGAAIDEVAEFRRAAPAPSPASTTSASSPNANHASSTCLVSIPGTRQRSTNPARSGARKHSRASGWGSRRPPPRCCRRRRPTGRGCARANRHPGQTDRSSPQARDVVAANQRAASGDVGRLPPGFRPAMAQPVMHTPCAKSMFTRTAEPALARGAMRVTASCPGRSCGRQALAVMPCHSEGLKETGA